MPTLYLQNSLSILNNKLIKLLTFIHWTERQMVTQDALKVIVQRDADVLNQN